MIHCDRRGKSHTHETRSRSLITHEKWNGENVDDACPGYAPRRRNSCTALGDMPDVRPTQIRYCYYFCVCVFIICGGFCVESVRNGREFFFNFCFVIIRIESCFDERMFLFVYWNGVWLYILERKSEI